MQRGFITRAYNSYYYVQTLGQVEAVACKLRGRFKKERFSLLVGDEVAYSPVNAGEGIIEEIMPRRSLLERPPIANVDQVVLTFAAVNPDIGATLVDKFMVLAEKSGLPLILCVNKMELSHSVAVTRLMELYVRIGYTVIPVSAKTGMGIETLRELLKDKITVFAGPSGAGKSSLLNKVDGGLVLKTGEISAKIGRGKHTTRFAALLPLEKGGFVVDTPGFSAAEFVGMEAADLRWYFPEMVKVAGNCRYSTCLHDREPSCAVKQAVEEGAIAHSRYESYHQILTEIKEG